MRRCIAIIIVLLFLECKRGIRPQASTIEEQFLGVEFRNVEVVIEISVVRIVMGERKGGGGV
jgi:hypothetical protein